LDKIYTGFYDKDFTYKDLPDVIETNLNEFKFSPVFRIEEQERMKAIGQAVLENYIVWYKKDFVEMRFEEVESKFDVRWEGFRLRGKKDGRFRTKDNSVWHIEHKNYGRINEESMVLKLAFDLQNLMYLLADHVEFDRILKGVLYNVLRRPDVKKAMSIHEIYKYLKDLIKKDPQHYFLRFEIPYTKVDLTIFKGELLTKLTQLQTECELAHDSPENTPKIFYKNEFACEMPYKCDFLNACSSGQLIGYCKKSKLFSELEDDVNNKTRAVEPKLPSSRPIPKSVKTPIESKRVYPAKR
jgi:hypothetical protein